jgi:hypothetical protein
VLVVSSSAETTVLCALCFFYDEFLLSLMLADKVITRERFSLRDRARRQCVSNEAFYYEPNEWIRSV